MDILIKNMEMPDCCYGCPCSYDMGEGNYACLFRYGYAPLNERRDDCPLVALPEHGDLIDRNELPLTWITDHKLDGHTVVEFEDVKNAPVIVEANNGTDN